MKWLLVTTNPQPHLPGTDHPHGAGWNVGDVFARIGTEQAIRQVDPAAQFEIVNMDSAASITTPRPFDRAVFAGRPMFWKGCDTHPLWSELLNGWLCKDPRKVMALGVGDCYELPQVDNHMERMIAAARARCWKVTVRRRGFGDFIACPATWAIMDRKETPTRPLCNLMPKGAHYPEFDRHAASKWNAMLPRIACDWIDRGFEFVAHSLDEATLARDLGWNDRAIHFGMNVTTYLSIYAQAKSYIGNRIHGGLVLASRQAEACVIGLDSRIFAATSLGVYAKLIAEVPRYVYTPPVSVLDVIHRRITAVRLHREHAVEVLKEFAN